VEPNVPSRFSLSNGIVRATIHRVRHQADAHFDRKCLSTLA
jgi:hypothetical protein